MKSFACGDVVPGCDARFVAGTEEALLSQVADHAAAAHGIAEVPDALADQVRSLIVAAG